MPVEFGVVDEVVEERRGQVEGRDPLLSISARASPASQRACGTKQPPTRGIASSEWIAHRVVQRHHAERAVAPAVAVLERLRQAPARSARWERGTPFGRPVVPDV